MREPFRDHGIFVALLHHLDVPSRLLVQPENLGYRHGGCPIDQAKGQAPRVAEILDARDIRPRAAILQGEHDPVHIEPITVDPAYLHRGEFFLQCVDPPFVFLHRE